MSGVEPAALLLLKVAEQKSSVWDGVMTPGVRRGSCSGEVRGRRVICMGGGFHTCSVAHVPNVLLLHMMNCTIFHILEDASTDPAGGAEDESAAGSPS